MKNNEYHLLGALYKSDQSDTLQLSVHHHTI